MKLKVVNGGSELQVSEAAFGHEIQRGAGPPGRSPPTATRAAPAPRRRRPAPKCAAAAASRWSQKGTGQARAGSSRSPIWVGGGRAFAAKPRDFAQKVNRKMYRGAIRSMLSELARTDRLVVTDDDRARSAEDPAARSASSSNWELDERADRRRGDRREAVPRRAQPAARRGASRSTSLNPLSLASHEKVLMTVGAVKMLEERLQ